MKWKSKAVSKSIKLHLFQKQQTFTLGSLSDRT